VVFISNKYHMLFIKNLNPSVAPWRICNQNKGTIRDANNRLLARVQKPGEVPPHEREANLRLIAAAPELLAALREAAYHLHNAGIELNQPFYDLINRVSPEAEPIAAPQTMIDKRKKV
jgi:hypothetical protein